MRKQKEVIEDYKKKMQQLIDAAMRTRTHFSKKIKKETVGHLIKLGVDEFEAVELLEKLNDFSLKCSKCGSQYLYVPNAETQ
jgi:hypothetical protein